jgi:hypothetical protein
MDPEEGVDYQDCQSAAEREKLYDRYISKACFVIIKFSFCIQLEKVYLTQGDLQSLFGMHSTC